MSVPALPADLRVLRPDDAGYADETAGFQTGFAHRPALVCPAVSAADVTAAVAYAAARDLPVDVQATGHGLPGEARGRLLVSTRRMDAVRVDPARRTARIAAGARWAQVVKAAAPHSLAPLNGSALGVGAVSYTLGGGLGILGRAFGYAADHVRGLDVVTADARRRHVTPASEPDLFWALLGGGADFGVVTGLWTDLVPVARLYGGALVFDGGVVDPAAALAAYVEWTRGVPDGLTSSFAALPYPDVPALPGHLRGRYVVSIRVAYTGQEAQGARLVAPLRAIGPVLADSLRVMPYTRSHTIHSDPDSPHAYYGDSAVLGDLEAAAGGRLLELTGRDAPFMCVVQVNHLGGALAAPPRVPNAVPHRNGRFLVRLLSVLDAATDRERVRAHYARVFEALAPRTVGRSLNFSFGGSDRADGLYEPATRARLAALKDRYDPQRLFRRGYGLSGAAESGAALR